VEINQSTFNSNSATFGGAVFNQGELDLSESTLNNNGAVPDGQSLGVTTGGGGGLFNAGTLRVRSSFFNQCVAKGSGRQFGIPEMPSYWGLGGGLFNLGNATISQSCFVSNRTEGAVGFPASPGASGGGYAGGAGIYSGNKLVLENCTFNANSTVGGAGAFFNTELITEGGNANGAALYLSNRAEIHFSTFANNRSTPGAGSRYFYDSNSGTSYRTNAPGLVFGSSIYAATNASVTIRASILGGTAEGTNTFGPIQDLGFNISSDASPAFQTATSLNKVDATLGVFGNYGGPTPTIPLLFGSLAIDAIPSGADVPRTDQRGATRPAGSAADIGAFEQNLKSLTILPGTNSTGVISFFAEPGGKFQLEQSSNFLIWTPLTFEATGTNTGAFRAEQTLDAQKRFFRAKSN
jgi:hypothetical protein